MTDHKPGDRPPPDGSANRNPDGTLKELDPGYDQPGSRPGDRPQATPPAQAPGMGTLYPDDEKAGE
jgi:hypothetical protein